MDINEGAVSGSDCGLLQSRNMYTMPCGLLVTAVAHIREGREGREGKGREGKAGVGLPAIAIGTLFIGMHMVLLQIPGTSPLLTAVSGTLKRKTMGCVIPVFPYMTHPSPHSIQSQEVCQYILPCLWDGR